MSIVEGSTSLSHAVRASQGSANAVLKGRIAVRGKFLVQRIPGENDRTFWVKGVTYGPFGPGGSAAEYGCAEQADRDFSAIRAAGFNAIRTYTPPPMWLLDLAQQHGLRVMVGLAWEQHVTFLADRARAADIETRVRNGVRRCSGHPAVLCYAVGN